MSYAQAAAKGPKQTPSEVSNYVYYLANETGVSDLSGVSTNDSAAPQPPEIEPSTTASTSSLVDVDSGVSVVPPDFKSQEIKTETQAERIKLESEVEKLKPKKEKAKSHVHSTKQTLQKNADNPVFIGNGVLYVVLGSVLGYNGYKKYTAGELTWKVVGLWTGAVGLFAVGDYYASQYLFKKYPKK